MTGLEDWLAGVDACYFDCNDSEHLSHDDPVEAILEYAEGWCGGPGPFEQEWARDGDAVTVKAYQRMEVKAVHRDRAAQWAIDTIREQISEADDGYSDPEGGDDGIDKPEQFLPQARALVDAIVAEMSIWGCTVVSQYEVPKDEVLALVRAERPEWLTKEGATP